MSACHSHHEHTARAALWLALALNLGMFAVEIWQGVSANSTALLADSMDFLSDGFNYAISLFVFSKALSVRAKASLLKAGLMLLIAVAVLVQGAWHVWQNKLPLYQTMGWVAVLALVVNVICALVLYRSRGRDSNMQSVWLCSRNDAIGNVAVLVAAYLVYLTQTLWPDLIVAMIMAWLGVSAALKIIAQARKELVVSTNTTKDQGL